MKEFDSAEMGRRQLCPQGLCRTEPRLRQAARRARRTTRSPARTNSATSRSPSRARPARSGSRASGISAYSSAACTLGRLCRPEGKGKKINVAYVFDTARGIKLFADQAFFAVRPMTEAKSHHSCSRRTPKPTRPRSTARCVGFDEAVKTAGAAEAEAWSRSDALRKSQTTAEAASTPCDLRRKLQRRNGRAAAAPIAALAAAATAADLRAAVVGAISLTLFLLRLAFADDIPRQSSMCVSSMSRRRSGLERAGAGAARFQILHGMCC